MSLAFSWRHHLADFLESFRNHAISENGQGEERKINGEPATPILVADTCRDWSLKQNLRKMDGSLTYILFTGPLNVL
jgi:hypothetical protein